MKTFAVFLVFIFSATIKAQERLGVVNSNYLSTGSIFMNPSSSADSKTYMQLNLVGVNAFAFNNMAYLPWFSIWRLRRHPGEIQAPELSSLRTKKFLYANVVADGPAFVISKRNYGAGIYARARSVADVRGIPYDLVDIFLKDGQLPDSNRYNLRNVKFSSMTWVEFGANFAMIIKKNKKDLWLAGGNVKYITGINIAYANMGRLRAFYNDTTLQLQELTGKVRYNLPGWNTGKGYGLDAAITYKKMLKTVDNYLPHSVQGNCATADYKYKATLAIRDAGYVRFTKGGTRTDVNASGAINPVRDTTQEAIELKLNISTQQGNILATLPTNLTAQFDWNLENKIFLNATLVKSVLPHSLTGVQSPNYISFCPRFELKQFEVAVPLTFQKFLYPQLGLGLRYRTFTLGFDNLFPVLFMKPRTFGVGVYFSLGVSLFKNRACRLRQSIADCPPNSMSGRKSKKKSGSPFKKRRKKGAL